ncbi:MAG: 3-hydroxyacyl-ACP dehydratase FabZ [Selenomonadales bacterium]|jgi:3-hydroxyacyl-[acyl-carrier-protein] dehydratase|nr:3-hydroxyacyl-ACP dehydratase FabZ [Selenomonadales bacterium]
MDKPLGAREIMEIIPHRYPFLLVDSIEYVVPGERAVGYKNVTANEPYFAGHFPNYPVMPGVLIVEALAQVGAVALLSLPENKGRLAFFAGIDGVRFRRQVFPGDRLRLEVSISSMKMGIGKGDAKAYVGEELAVSGQLMFALAKEESSSAES